MSNVKQRKALELPPISPDVERYKREIRLRRRQYSAIAKKYRQQAKQLERAAGMRPSRTCAY